MFSFCCFGPKIIYLGIKVETLKAAIFICTWQLCPSSGISSLNWFKKWTMSWLDREASSCRTICGTGPCHYHPPVICGSLSLEHSHCGKIISWTSSGNFHWLLEMNQSCGWKRLMRIFVKPVFNLQSEQNFLTGQTHTEEGICLRVTVHVFGDELWNYFQFLFSHWI